MVRLSPRAADVMHTAGVMGAWGCLDTGDDGRDCSPANMHVPRKPKGQRQEHIRSQQPFAFPPVLAPELAAPHRYRGLRHAFDSASGSFSMRMTV